AAAHAGKATGEERVRRLAAGVGADRLRDPGSDPVEDRCGRLRGHVAWRDTRAAGRQHEPCTRLRELLDRARDLGALVRDAPPLDCMPPAAQELVERVAAPVFARAAMDTVRDGQHGRLHSGSLVFSTSRTPSIVISLSTALAMSYTVSAATEAAVRASISTPV